MTTNKNEYYSFVKKEISLRVTEILYNEARSAEKRRGDRKAKIINQGARFPVPMTNTISPNFGHLYTLRPG